LFNNNSCFGKINISPEISLNDFREKIINLIPRRAIFLMEDEEIDPSQEENFSVKAIANQKIINFKFPIEDQNDPIEIEILLNGKHFIKKEFYLKIKLKYLRTNLKFDETYKLVYKGKTLSENEEKLMTLDELCYKELKVFFVKIKDNTNVNINLYTNNKKFLETKAYQNTSFKINERFDTWIIIGKEKSGKTTFINCLCNYINGIKFEYNFRYLIEAKKQNSYQIYNFQDNSFSQKISAIEFPGFSGEIEYDKLINKDIKKFIKTITEVKVICFVINGNETRLTDDLKNIFSNIWDIFAIDIKTNFIFILTNCDAKQPPILDCFENSGFSRFMSKKENWIFKFNNSFLFEINQKELWEAGISHYKELINSINKKDSISLNLTKNYIEINIEYPKNLKNFINSTKKLINYRNYFNILKKIDSYDKASNKEIPFEFFEVNIICAKCNRAITYNSCQKCHSNKIKEKRIQSKKTTLKYLKNNNKLYLECLNTYKTNIKKQIIDSALIYKSFKDFYKLKLFQNCSLENELSDILDKNEIDKKVLNQEINYQESLYNNFISQQVKYEYKIFLEKTLNI